MVSLIVAALLHREMQEAREEQEVEQPTVEPKPSKRLTGEAEQDQLRETAKLIESKEDSKYLTIEPKKEVK